MNESSASVSLVLLTFNQEQYIDAAVRSALLQSHEPLEIVISDDASSDRTFQILQDLVATYQGPHTVVLNRNKHNLGIARHLQHAMGLCHGDLVVACAGDDVSAPNRVEALVARWRSQGKPTAVLHSMIHAIDSEGRSTHSPAGAEAVYYLEGAPTHRIVDTIQGVLGATSAWTRDLFDTFPALSERHAAEDVVLAFRAALSGQILFVAEALVQYRVGTSTWISSQRKVDSAEKLMAFMLRDAEWKRDTLRQMIIDTQGRNVGESLLQRLEGKYLRHSGTAEMALNPGFKGVASYWLRRDSWRNWRLIISSFRCMFPNLYFWHWQRRMNRASR